MQRGLQPAMIAAGLTKKVGKVQKAKYTGLHALRHFYASWCINRCVDGGLELPLKVVQTRMGIRRSRSPQTAMGTCSRGAMTAPSWRRPKKRSWATSS